MAQLFTQGRRYTWGREAQREARPLHDKELAEPGELLKARPLAHLRKIVGTQDEMQAVARSLGSKGTKGIGRVGGALTADLEGRDLARHPLPDRKAHHLDAIGARGELRLGLMRGDARGHEHHTVGERDAQEIIGHLKVARVDGVERPSKDRELQLSGAAGGVFGGAGGGADSRACSLVNRWK